MKPLYNLEVYIPELRGLGLSGQGDYNDCKHLNGVLWGSSKPVGATPRTQNHLHIHTICASSTRQSAMIPKSLEKYNVAGSPLKGQLRSLAVTVTGERWTLLTKSSDVSSSRQLPLTQPSPLRAPPKRNPNTYICIYIYIYIDKQIDR